MSSIPKIAVGDVLLLKKPHPCGCNRFVCMRVGSDIRIICSSCGRDLTLPREKLERAIKKILPKESEDTKES